MAAITFTPESTFCTAPQKVNAVSIVLEQRRPRHRCKANFGPPPVASLNINCFRTNIMVDIWESQVIAHYTEILHRYSSEVKCTHVDNTPRKCVQRRQGNSMEVGSLILSYPVYCSELWSSCVLQRTVELSDGSVLINCAHWMQSNALPLKSPVCRCHRARTV